MIRIIKLLAAVLGDRKGVTALEYAALAVGIITAVAGAALTLGTKVSSLLNSTSPYI